MLAEARKAKNRLAEICVRSWRAPSGDRDNGTRETRGTQRSGLTDEVDLLPPPAAGSGAEPGSSPPAALGLRRPPGCAPRGTAPWACVLEGHRAETAAVRGWCGDLHQMLGTGLAYGKHFVYTRYIL